MTIIADYRSIIRCYPFNLKIGEGTDDTLMMLALAETYCETGYFDRTVFLHFTLREDCSAEQPKQ